MHRVITARYFPYIVASLALAALLWVSILLWSERTERFPALQAGIYLLKIKGLPANLADRNPQFLLKRQAASEELKIIPMQSGLKPQLISLSLALESATKQPSQYFPIVINLAESKLKLIGSNQSAQLYTGKVLELSSGAEGAWQLTALELPEKDYVEAELRELRLWLSLKTELNSLEARIKEAEQEVPKQKRESERLEEFVSEGVGLRQRADQKFGEVKGLVRASQERLKLKRQEAKELEEKILLSQRITPSGRLVSLARESLDRETRWADLLFKVAGNQEDNPGLNQEVAKGLKVIELREAIAREHRIIDELRFGPSADTLDQESNQKQNSMEQW